MTGTAKEVTDLFKHPEGSSRESLIASWTLAIKISAIDCKYYSCPQIIWVPRVGDFWCLTRDGGELKEMLEVTDGSMIYQRLYSEDWIPLPEPTIEESSIEVFNENLRYRVPIPFWAWEQREIFPVKSPPEGVPVLMRFDE